MEGNRKRAPADRSPMTRRLVLRRAWIATAAVALVPTVHVVRGYQSDSDDAESDGDATPPVTTLEPLAVSGTPGATPAGTPEAERHLVEMNDELLFVPEELTLRVGDTVVWRTVGAIPHTSTCDPELAENPEEHVQLPEGAETWDSGTVGEGEEYELTFEVPGEYTYFCIPHEGSGMIGYLTVEE